MEMIHEQGFEGDYFVSPFWSSSSTYAWNSELAVRLNLMLEAIAPDVIVFDGTWPFQGLRAVCMQRRNIGLIWSNRGRLKEGVKRPPVEDSFFDLILEPGEIGTSIEDAVVGNTRKMRVPPVCLLESSEFLGREQAREALSLPQHERWVLFVLGPGNLKDVSGIGQGLIEDFQKRGFQVAWAQPPISVQDVELPEGVRPLSLYPLAQYLNAFDYFVSAAGYNACCEALQAGIPTLFVPNNLLSDDQQGRAQFMTTVMPAVVDDCETPQARHNAVDALLRLSESCDLGIGVAESVRMDGASLGAKAILEAAQKRMQMRVTHA
ncbi:hypothetical protein [Orrella sp. 11846]|uniref:hypothetical protein n=1 Tax=Orrella sp. 11846 TaxID=3409913 RepID=UPI003B59EDA4